MKFAIGNIMQQSRQFTDQYIRLLCLQNKLCVVPHPKNMPPIVSRLGIFQSLLYKFYRLLNDVFLVHCAKNMKLYYSTYRPCLYFLPCFNRLSMTKNNSITLSLSKGLF